MRKTLSCFEYASLFSFMSLYKINIKTNPPPFEVVTCSHYSILVFPFVHSFHLESYSCQRENLISLRKKTHQKVSSTRKKKYSKNLNFAKVIKRVRGERGNDKSKLLFFSAPKSSCFECHFNFRFVTLKHAMFRRSTHSRLSLSFFYLPKRFQRRLFHIFMFMTRVPKHFTKSMKKSFRTGENLLHGGGKKIDRC